MSAGWRLAPGLRFDECPAEIAVDAHDFPVDFISGPSSTSTPANLVKGKTASFTEMRRLRRGGEMQLLQRLPTITFMASLARGRRWPC